MTDDEFLAFWERFLKELDDDEVREMLVALEGD